MKKVDFDKVVPRFTRAAPYAVDVPFDYLETHLQRIDEDRGVILDPDFQRAHVWTEQQQINYVEYRMRGGHAASELYFNSPGFRRGSDSPMVLVDGKQRLQAVRRFLNNEIKAFGYYYAQYERFDPILDFRFYVNDLKTRAEVLQWYLDLNTGGVVHTDEEIEKVEKLLEAENDKG